MRAVRSRLGAFVWLALVGCSARTGAYEGGSDSSSTVGDTSSSTDSSSTSTSDSSTSDTSTTDDTTDTTDTTDTSDTDDPLPEMPVLELSFSQTKQFDFSWPAATGAEYYQLLESASEGEPFMQLGADIVGESISITMPLHLRAHASYVLRACNTSGCVESASVEVMSNLAEAVGYFKASNPGENDYLGESVALSDDGDTMAVGAPFEGSNATGIDGNQADNSALRAGAVYVFVRIDGVWSQQAYVKASNTDSDDRFGFSVALSGDGDTLAVGALQERSNATGIDGNQADNSAEDAGAVYVFTRNGAVWSQQAYVKASNTETRDYFGQSVALSGNGDTLVVGAHWEDSSATGIDGDQLDNSTLSSGAAYVFVRNGGVWSQQAYVKASNPAFGDRFGHSMTLASNGDTLAVGTNGNETVYVFVRNGGVWSQQAVVEASNSDDGDQFGYSVALSNDGDTLAVGADREQSKAVGIDSDPADNSIDNAGAAYVFVRADGLWSQQAYVKASNTGEGDYFGQSVALSENGNILAVGAYGESSTSIGIDGIQANDFGGGAGAVYVFVRDGDVWSQRAYVKPCNTDEGTAFGWGVALSNDGTTLSVSARWEHSGTMGVNGPQDQNDGLLGSGGAYLY